MRGYKNIWSKNHSIIMNFRGARLMKQILCLGMVAVMWSLFAFDCHAEVSVRGHDLNANLKGASLEKVILRISQQANIEVAVSNMPEYGKSMVSDIFKDLPLEQRLDRLLNGWNYALSKDPTTGKVRQLMIVSRRSGLSDASPLAQQPLQVVSNSVEAEDPSQGFEEMDILEVDEEDAYLTDEDLLNNAPPEVRELIASMQGRDGLD